MTIEEYKVPSFRPRGMNDQRDRSRRKKHHKSKHSRQHAAPSSDSWTLFESWLADEFHDELGNPVLPTASFDLKRFLQTCHPVDLDSDEKLRQLAIHWESDCAAMKQPAGWRVLKRIYEEAIRMDPSWVSNYHSLALSAHNCAGWLDRDASAWVSIMADAKDACLRGLAVDPNASVLHLSLGNVLYEQGETALALESFDTAIHLDPTQMWAQLYRAHCLHDMKQWQSAADAYSNIDRSFFDGPTSWRAILLREQMASCLFQAGDRSRALAEFERSLRQYEANPGLLYVSDYLKEACKFFPGQFARRVLALLKRDENRCLE